MEWWNNGILGIKESKEGNLSFRPIIPAFQFSIIPVI